MQWLINGQYLDVAAGAFRRGAIAVDAGKIVKLSGDVRPAKDDTVIDLKGGWILPGLIDCHVHLTQPTDSCDYLGHAKRSDAEVALYTAKAAERTLLCGITTIREVGGWNFIEMAVRDAIARGDYAGPRMLVAGRILSITTSGMDLYPGMYEIADGADAVRAAARKQLAQGADLIKVMATGAVLSPESEDPRSIQYTLEELKAAVEIAEDNFKHVAAHAHACRGIANAVAAGCSSIEHGTYADEAVLREMAAKGVFLVPTQCTLDAMLNSKEAMATMPPHQVTRMIDTGKVSAEAIRRAYELGVPIAMGTDAGTPGNHHGENWQELIVMVRDCGVTPIDSIRAATVNAAKLIRRHESLGEIKEGYIADLVAYPANPLDDIKAVAHIGFVMKDGQVYKNGFNG
jgi:imidazolonepropionase-like amidohydrolase